MNERSKHLVEHALNAGRHFQSKQTGFVHFCFQIAEGDVHQTISIYHNFLFVLALFRSRTVENITEGKGLLEKLLVFQNPQKGNFPVYLHDYPHCWDHFQGVYILTPIYWILKYFGHILGYELKAKLESGTKEIFQYVSKLEREVKLPFHIQARLSASKVAFGVLWKDVNLLELGTQQLQNLQDTGHWNCWDSTESISHILMGLQMVYSRFHDSPWKSFWNYVVQTWQYNCCAYLGPSSKEKQSKGMPQINFYDYFMNFYSNQGVVKNQTGQISQLESILIHPSDNHFENGAPHKLEGVIGSNHLTVINEADWGFTLLDKNGEEFDKLHTPFKLVHGDSFHVHTFICQNHFAEKIEYFLKDFEIELFFHLADEVDLTNRERSREVNFYLDFHENINFLIEGISSNTFKLGEKIEILIGERKVEMFFECVEGEGQFLGHFARGNRPSQLDVRGDNRFQAYDWNLFIRTIRRSGKSVLKAKIRIH